MHDEDGLAGLRRRIDSLDDRIVDLLGERFALVREVAAYKSRRNIPAVIPERIEQVIERCIARGRRHGLDAEMLRDVYRRLIQEACRVEEEILSVRGRSASTAVAHD